MVLLYLKFKTKTKNTEHQYTIDALAQSKHSDDKITLSNLTLIDSLICPDV